MTGNTTIFFSGPTVTENMSTRSSIGSKKDKLLQRLKDIEKTIADDNKLKITDKKYVELLREKNIIRRQISAMNEKRTTPEKKKKGPFVLKDLLNEMQKDCRPLPSSSPPRRRPVRGKQLKISDLDFVPKKKGRGEQEFIVGENVCAPEGMDFDDFVTGLNRDTEGNLIFNQSEKVELSEDENFALRVQKEADDIATKVFGLLDIGTSGVVREILALIEEDPSIRTNKRYRVNLLAARLFIRYEIVNGTRLTAIKKAMMKEVRKMNKSRGQLATKEFEDAVRELESMPEIKNAIEKAKESRKTILQRQKEITKTRKTIALAQPFLKPRRAKSLKIETCRDRMEKINREKGRDGIVAVAKKVREDIRYIDMRTVEELITLICLVDLIYDPTARSDRINQAREQFERLNGRQLVVKKSPRVQQKKKKKVDKEKLEKASILLRKHQEERRASRRQTLKVKLDDEGQMVVLPGQRKGVKAPPSARTRTFRPPRDPGLDPDFQATKGTQLKRKLKLQDDARSVRTRQVLMKQIRGDSRMIGQLHPEQVSRIRKERKEDKKEKGPSLAQIKAHPKFRDIEGRSRIAKSGGKKGLMEALMKMGVSKEEMMKN